MSFAPKKRPRKLPEKKLKVRVTYRPTEGPTEFGKPEAKPEVPQAQPPAEKIPIHTHRERPLAKAPEVVGETKKMTPGKVWKILPLKQKIISVVAVVVIVPVTVSAIYWIHMGTLPFFGSDTLATRTFSGTLSLETRSIGNDVWAGEEEVFAEGTMPFEIELQKLTTRDGKVIFMGQTKSTLSYNGDWSVRGKPPPNPDEEIRVNPSFGEVSGTVETVILGIYYDDELRLLVLSTEVPTEESMYIKYMITLIQRPTEYRPTQTTSTLEVVLYSPERLIVDSLYDASTAKGSNPLEIPTIQSAGEIPTFQEFLELYGFQWTAFRIPEPEETDSIELEGTETKQYHGVRWEYVITVELD